MERNVIRARERMDELVRRCREAGMNVTPQRMAVYKALIESVEHPTPEMLFRKVRRSMPSLSLATIYKALETLEKLGLAHEVSTIAETRRYDGNMDKHHHLVCSRCNRVMDYYDEELDRLTPKALDGFRPESISVNIIGVCNPCAARQHG